MSAVVHSQTFVVPAESEFAHFRARTVCQYVALLHALALKDDRLLADTRVLIGALKFRELIDVCAHLTRKLTFLRSAFHAHNDSLGID